jgi:hypothetical protein
MNCKDTQAVIDSTPRRAMAGQLASTHVAAHLADCTNCRRYANQSSALSALLVAQPRVEAPPDFAFRLRARIARTESQPSGPFAFLENFFGQSFSIRQTAAALAALAVMAAATTFYFTSGNQPAATPTTIARVEVPAPSIAQSMPAVAAEEKSEAVKTNTPRPVLRAASNQHASAVRIAPAVLPREANIASANKENMARVYVRGRGQMMEMPTRTVFGAEGSVAMARPASYTAGF